MLIQTGIPKLDDILGGGVESGSTVLLLSDAGVDPMLFLSQSAYFNIIQGRRCLFFVDSFTPAAIKKRVSAMKLWDQSAFDKVMFIDNFSAKLGQPSTAKYTVKDPGESDDVIRTVDRALKENRGDALILFSDVDRLYFSYGGAKSLQVLDDAIASSNEMRTTAVFSLVNWDFSNDFLEEVIKRFEYVVRLKSVEDRFLTRTFYFVEKSPRKFMKTVVPFRPGLDGIGVFVPKLIVTGPFHSGKSSFIQKVSTRAVSVDRLGTTVALDHGFIDYGGISVDLFGTPGQERFEFMLDILKKDTFGILLLVDSTDPSSFDRAKEILSLVGKEALPYVVAANKQDVEGAMEPDEIKKAMGLPSGVNVIGTSAVTGDGCVDAVKALIDSIVQRGSSVDMAGVRSESGARRNA